MIKKLAVALAALQVATANTEGAPREWSDYRTIMWVGDSVWKKPERFPVFIQRMKEMSINTGMVFGDAEAKPWVDAGFPFYVENVVNKGLCLKFSSPVTDWDAFVTKWAKTGRPAADLVRPYSLDDPQWNAWAQKRMADFAAKHKSHRPLAIDIRDELSVTISANPFDFDFSESSLKSFREWLKVQYGTLEKLNAQWETKFIEWEEVKPFTTDQIKNRMASGDAIPRGNPDWQAVQQVRFDSSKAAAHPTAWNFSPWADHRSYMDTSLAAALAKMRDASRAVDPETPVGIEGTQMPHAFGGYDLWKLSQSLDWMEPYDICSAREILGSFMPGKPLLTTVGEKDARSASRRLWHLRLLGDRGCIVWWSEDCIDWNNSDWALTARAKGLAEVLREMTSPLAQLFLKATPIYDPLFIHYSQPSIQIAWLMESTVDGSTWLRRFSSYEASHNRHARVREGWLKALQDLGYSPQFIHGSQLASLPAEARVILPESWALSDHEISVLNKLHGKAMGSGPAGVFDSHAKYNPSRALASEVPTGASFVLGGEVDPNHAENYASERLKPEPATGFPSFVSRHAGRSPDVRIDPRERVRIHRYALGPMKLLAFERNIAWQMSEALSQAGGNEALEKPGRVTVGLPSAMHLYDLRTGKALGKQASFTFELDPWRPALFAIGHEPLKEGDPVTRLHELVK